MIRLRSSLTDGLRGSAITAQSVCGSLQNAIELEHSTIPVYLYALYSLDADLNATIAEIIESVVVEEMLHMTLAANVLNALGGSPLIDTPGFIPKYPGPLPGGVDHDLTVNLARFSLDQLATFLQIEEPEDPLKKIGGDAPRPGTITIGDFYTSISNACASLGDGAFAARNQVTPDLMWGSIVVSNVATAQQAIQTIIDQGEGASTSPLEPPPPPQEGGAPDYAHYYRFREILEGRRLIPVPANDPPWAYAGDPIALNPAGVYNLPTNPALNPYPPGSPQAFANDNFNYTYTSLLSALHALFNGDATPLRFNRALGLMMSLKGQAKAMAAGIPNPDVVVGPTFEYQPVNPGP